MTIPLPSRVPLRRSLLTRLLLVSLLIALVSIGATAWLAVTSTTRALQQEQGSQLTDQSQAYDTLIGYAAGHRTWDGVQDTLNDLTAKTGWDLRLTTRDHIAIAAAGPNSSPVWPAQPLAVIDPLNTAAGLGPGARYDGIDPRALGVYQISSAERSSLRARAKQIAVCVNHYNQDETGSVVRIVEDPMGRPQLQSSGPMGLKASTSCGSQELDVLPKRQALALKELNTAIARCLRRQGLKPVTVNVNFQAMSETGSNTAAVQKCVLESRQDQLRTYVAPPALLYVGSPEQTNSRITLSPGNIWRIVLVTSLVLLLTMLLTTLVGLRLVRPLRTLLRALQQPTTNTRVAIDSNDEIGTLAIAFNDLAARRERLENQRKAMISDIAHELRTPLSNVRGWLQAAEDNLTARDQALTGSLLEEALHLQRIVDDLQDSAQADAGELNLQLEQVDLAELIALITHTHRGTADITAVHLGCDVPSELIAWADPTRLRQVIGNLVSNALRHTPPGGSVLIRGRAAADGSVRVDVADTGTGISAQDLPHVFDRFWRAERSRSRSTGGSGLGLAIARQLVEAHQGNLTVTSELGQGTTFTLLLPAGRA